MASKVKVQENKEIQVQATEVAKVVENAATPVFGKKTLEGVKVLAVTSPAKIMAVSQSIGVDPGDVFVRAKFDFKGVEFYASNKLKFLMKAGYEQLQKSVKDGSELTVTVDIDKEFFYIENDVAIDDLFKSSEKVERKSLADLLA